MQMLLWHGDTGEMKKMVEALQEDAKFLFDTKARAAYGLGTEPVFWYRENVRVDTAGRDGPYIDLRFRLATFVYPHALARILQDCGWKIKSRYCEMWVGAETVWDAVRCSGPWTCLCDAGFPVWGAGADRRRQEGRRGLRARLAELQRLCED